MMQKNLNKSGQRRFNYDIINDGILSAFSGGSAVTVMEGPGPKSCAAHLFHAPGAGPEGTNPRPLAAETGAASGGG